MQPSLINVNTIGQMEGYTHHGTLIYLDEKANMKELIKLINAFLCNQNEITFGITAAPKNGLIIRLLGFKGEQLFNCIKTISTHYFSQKSIEYAGRNA